MSLESSQLEREVMHEIGGPLGKGSAAVGVGMGEGWAPMDAMEEDADDWPTEEEDIQKVVGVMAEGIEEHHHHYIRR
jgi:hypothetical protein